MESMTFDQFKAIVAADLKGEIEPEGFKDWSADDTAVDNSFVYQSRQALGCCYIFAREWRYTGGRGVWGTGPTLGDALNAEDMAYKNAMLDREFGAE